MADTNNLTNFLGDVADAIRAKTGNNDPIPAANFDTEIANIATGTELPDGIYIQNVTPIKNTPEAFWLYEHSGDKASDLIPPETMIGASISFGQIKSALIDQNLLNDFDAAYYHVFAVSYGGNYASVAFSNNAYRVYSSYSANQTYVGNGTANVCVCNFAVNNANPNNLFFNNQGQVGYWSNANYQSWTVSFCDKDILYSNGVLWRAADELGTNQDGLSINVGNGQYVVYQSEAGVNTFDKILNSQGMNATSNDIIFGKTAVVNNQKITGNIQQYSINITPSMATQTINNGYYTNSQINSISVSNEYINWINTSENILGTTVSRYNALEYLQGNNTQRIDTAYIPSANTSIEINIYKPSNSSYISWERVFSAGQGNFEVMRDNTSNQFIFHGSHGIIAGRFNIINNTFYTLKINNGALYLNNVRQFTFNQNSIMGDALNLFHGGDRNSGFRVYSCKIYDNDALQMDLHPAKDANNIACMYDRISGNYLYETNMKNFIAGPETNTLLNDVLDTMQSEKTTKIVPQNIANGITIFGITGNLVGGEDLNNVLNSQEALIANLQNQINILNAALDNAAGGGGSDIKVFNTYDDMLNDPSPSNGDLAVVRGMQIVNWDGSAPMDAIVFPNQVVFNSYIYYGPGSGDWYANSANYELVIGFDCASKCTEVSINDGTNNIAVWYDSDDGILYNSNMHQDIVVNFNSTEKFVYTGDYPDEWEASFGKFAKAYTMVTNGVFEYNNGYKLLQRVPSQYINNASGLFNDGARCNSIGVICSILNPDIKYLNEMFKNTYVEDYQMEAFNFDTSNIISTYQMFYGCQSLYTAPNMNLARVVDISEMFSECDYLENVPKYNFANANVCNNMFCNCNRLSQDSINNIVESMLTATNMRKKTLYTNNTSSPFYGTNITNDKYQAYWSDLTNAGWTY